MLEAAIIGSGRSTPGLCSSRRRILRLRRFNWRWRLAFTRRPPGGQRSRGVEYLDCGPNPGGFRAFLPQWACGDAWLRTQRRPVDEPDDTCPAPGVLPDGALGPGARGERRAGA